MNTSGTVLPLTVVVEVELRDESWGKIDEINQSFHEVPDLFGDEPKQGNN